MSSMRRGLMVVMVGGFCGTLALLHTSAAGPDRKAGHRQIQIKVAGPAGAAGGKGKNAGFADSFSFPTDRKARRTLEAAEDFIKDQSWGEAAKLLQSLLDTKEDVFVEVKRGAATHWTSLKGEANRLLGTMPAEGRAFYELQFGARAKNKLAEARSKSDHHLLAQVAQSYMHTDAGGEALDLLGTYHLDRGSFLNASLCYERLLQHHNAAKLSPVTLLKAHLAFRRNGEAARADEVWKRLTRAAHGGVRIGDQTVQLDQLSKELDRYSVLQGLTSLYDWPLFKGNPSRSAQGTGSAPFLEAKWVYPLTEEKQTEQWVEQAIKNQQERLQPVLPAFFPIAVTVRTDKETKPLLIYRSYWGIRARNLNKDGKLEWDTASDYGLDALVRSQEKALLINNNQWVQSYLNTLPRMLYENSTVGTLSTDNRFVYAVEDLVLPPHPYSNQMQQLQWGQPANFGILDKAVHHSRLQAFDLQSQGKLVWDLGGLSKDRDNKLSDCYFLGPPLPVGDKVYVLIDKNSELSLVCLDPPKDDKQVVVNWIQTLVNVRDKMLFDVGRRLQAAHLSYGDGILVCPTNAGVLLGVDLLSHSLAWAHSYREDNPDSASAMGGRPLRPGMAAAAVMPNGVPRAPKFVQDWKTSAPIIQDGRVVFTAPDASSVQCLNLRNGDLLWKQARADDLYLAGVYNGKVLLVGKSTCRALSLVDGHELWRNDTGLPSGQGVASGNTYYLPLKSGVESKKPEVCAIDIDTGKIPARTQSRKDQVPGNLLFYEGDVISQTATQIVAYRQLRIKREEINLALKKNPNDPVGLTERGELNLDAGDREGAAADLRNALAHNPPPAVRIKARNKLYETLTEMLRENFNANERYLDEYKDLCKVNIPEEATPTERQKLEEDQQRRQGNFLYLLAKGREGQGRLAEAFDAYLEFGALSSHQDLISVMDQPGVRARPDVWAQGRLAAMVANANPDQRRPLEEKIARQWQKVQADKDATALRHFVAVFGSLFTVGQEARMQLGERLLADKEYLEAELNFLELRDRGDKQIAGRAVEGLARLMTRQGLVEDAAYWYRVLGRDYPQVEIRNHKTGADFYNELATDKRLLAYLDEPRQAWASGRMRAKEVPGSYNQTHVANYVFEPEGEALPFFHHHRIALQNTYTLKVTDRTSSQDRWSLELNRATNLNGLLNSFNGHSNLRLPYYPLGHLVVLNLGPVVLGFDPVERKKLWEWNLFGAGPFPGQSFISQNPDGSFQVNYSNGDSQRLGRTGPIEASYVCLNTREGLVALDPLRGTILWTKSDVSLRTHVFGDDKYIYLVEVRADGTTGPGRALRAHDGVAVDIPDFGPLYQLRLRVVGRNLLLSEKTKSELVLRYYDVQTGKDHWKRSFSADSIVLKSEDSDLLGVVEPSKQARVTVLNLQTQKEVLNTKLDDPKDLEKAQAVYLLSDADRFYVAIHRPSDPNINPFGGPWSNLINGIRCVPVNGKVYAFGRETGKREWKGEAQNQMLVLDQFKDLPILLFSSRSQELVNVGGFNRGGNNMGSSTRSIEKRTGKLVYDKRVPSNQSPQFYALIANVAAGTVELVGFNMKIVHYLDNNSAEKLDTSAASTTSPKGPAEAKKPAPSIRGAVPKK